MLELGVDPTVDAKYFNSGLMVLVPGHPAFKSLVAEAQRLFIESPKRIRSFVYQDCWNIPAWARQVGANRTVEVFPDERWQFFGEKLRGRSTPGWHFAGPLKASKAYDMELTPWRQAFNGVSAAHPLLESNASVLVKLAGRLSS